MGLLAARRRRFSAVQTKQVGCVPGPAGVPQCPLTGTSPSTDIASYFFAGDTLSSERQLQPGGFISFPPLSYREFSVKLLGFVPKPCLGTTRRFIYADIIMSLNPLRKQSLLPLGSEAGNLP